MNKEELLKEITKTIDSGDIRKDEIIDYLNFSASTNYDNNLNVSTAEKETKIKSFFSASKILYVLGIVIAVIGIIFFIGQIWSDIGSFGRITVTLGLGILFAIIGSFLFSKKLEGNLGAIFHFIGGSIIPIGSIVTIHELGIYVDSLWPFVIVFCSLFIFYLLLNFAYKNSVLTFFSIVNGTILMYLFFEAITDGPFYRHESMYENLTIIIGISYLLLASNFKKNWNRNLVGLLNFFGITGFLSATFFKLVDSSGFLELLYFVIVLFGLYLSAYVKSRAILVMSTLFLIIHTTYITGEYFADSIGWPLALILLGFIFIGLGYASIAINKKYISSN